VNIILPPLGILLYGKNFNSYVYGYNVKQGGATGSTDSNTNLL